jgi:hypothetical protein
MCKVLGLILSIAKREEGKKEGERERGREGRKEGRRIMTNWSNAH